jgi:predicted solute-binding protein
MSYKVGEISFVNFLPLSPRGTEYPFPCEVKRAIPSALNNACRRGELDISPISFFAYPAIERDYALLPDFCIASDGEVMSVKLFSKYEISKLGDKKIYLTPDSESSIGALCAACKKRFGYDPRALECADRQAADAVFLIGDKALAFDEPYEYEYDLGKLWKDTFGIPMVFAAIAVRREFFGELAGALNRFYDANLNAFNADRDSCCELATTWLASEKFSAAAASEYFGRLTYKISADAFEKSRRILHEKSY